MTKIEVLSIVVSTVVAVSCATDMNRQFNQAVFDAIDSNDVARVGQVLTNDPSLLQKNGVAYLCRASARGRNDAVTKLLDMGVDADGVYGRHVESTFGAVAWRIDILPLGCAAGAGHDETVSLLIKRGASVNGPVGCGFPPIIQAATSGRVTALHILLEAGADVNAKDYRGSSALQSAALAGQKDAVVYLLDHGADVNAANNNGETPLRAAMRGGDKEIEQLIRDRGGK